jgi:hypothetical protein
VTLASVRAISATRRHRHQAFAKNLEERAEEIARHDHAQLRRVAFGRTLLAALTEEASELEHDILAGASPSTRLA